MDPLDLMWRDVHDVPFLIVFLVLPTILAVPLLMRRSRLALVMPGLLLGQLAAWFLYYATDATNPGAVAGLALLAMPTVISYVIVVVAWHTTRQRRPTSPGIGADIRAG